LAQEYPIIRVPYDAPIAKEATGSRVNFWYDHPQLGRCLYKEPRPETGEDWAEKVAAELCGLLDLPHARYELAEWKELHATISPSFEGAGQTLILGNVLLSGMDPDYPAQPPGTRRYHRVPQHTLDRVMSMMRTADGGPPGWIGIPAIASPAGVFSGYLLLDAWIGNTDRHHGNWGMLWERPPKDCEGTRIYLGALRLAPTYDHASSMGSHESDLNRQARLRSRDRGYNMEGYAERCLSAFYASEGDTKPMKTIDAFHAAARQQPEAAREWLRRLATVTTDQTEAILRRVPTAIISPGAGEFARALLEINQRRLLNLRGSIL